MVITSLPETKPRVGLTRRAVVEFVLVPVVTIAAIFGVAKLVITLWPALKPVSVAGLAGAMLLLSALTLLGFAALMRRHRIRPAEFGFTRPGWRMLHLLWQIPSIFIVGCAIQLFFVTTFDLSRPTQPYGGALPTSSTAVIVMVFVGTAVLTPVWEEILFRGVILGALRRRWGTALAVIVSALIFGAAHFTPVILPYLVVGGLGMAWLRLFHGNLWGSIIFHAVNNALATWVAIALLA